MTNPSKAVMLISKGTHNGITWTSLKPIIRHYVQPSIYAVP